MEGRTEEKKNIKICMHVYVSVKKEPHPQLSDREVTDGFVRTYLPTRVGVVLVLVLLQWQNWRAATGRMRQEQVS